MILSYLDPDLQMTLTFKASFLKYKYTEVKARSFFSFDLDTMTVILKIDLDMI